MSSNRMKPHHSGIFTWLQQTIIERLGEEQAQVLIQEADTHGTKRYQWLQDQMVEMGHADIKEECQRRIREDARQRYIRDKKRALKGLQEQLEKSKDNPNYAPFLRGRIAKIEAFLARQEGNMESSLFQDGHNDGKMLQHIAEFLKPDGLALVYDECVRRRQRVSPHVDLSEYREGLESGYAFRYTKEEVNEALFAEDVQLPGLATLQDHADWEKGFTFCQDGDLTDDQLMKHFVHQIRGF